MSADKFDPRFDAAFQPGFADRPAARSKRSSNPAKAALESLQEQSEDSPVMMTETGTAPKRRVNPFLIVLGALSVALIGAGVYGIRVLDELNASAFTYTSSSASATFYTTITVLPQLSSLSIALGVAIAAGVLFICAIAWQRKH